VEGTEAMVMVGDNGCFYVWSADARGDVQMWHKDSVAGVASDLLDPPTRNSFDD